MNKKKIKSNILNNYKDVHSVKSHTSMQDLFKTKNKHNRKQCGKTLRIFYRDSAVNNSRNLAESSYFFSPMFTMVMSCHYF